MVPGLDESTAAKRRNVRMFVDQALRYAMRIGGVGVIIAITLIFFYLLYEVAPLFRGAQAEMETSFAMPASQAGATRLLVLDEYSEIGVRYTEAAHVVYFDAGTGAVIQDQPLPVAAGVRVTAIGRGSPASGLVSLGLSDGSALVVQHGFTVSYPAGERVVTPTLEYPLGEASLPLMAAGQAVEAIAVRHGSEGFVLAAWAGGEPLRLVRYAQGGGGFLGESGDELERSDGQFELPLRAVDFLLLDSALDSVYAADSEGTLVEVGLEGFPDPTLRQQVKLVGAGTKLTALNFLNGDLSLLVGDSRGGIAQWFKVRGPQGAPVLREIRRFKPARGAVQHLVSEYNRKAFVAAAADGSAAFHHATANRRVLLEQVDQEGFHAVAISPRADHLLVETAAGRMVGYAVDNPHPEISFSALWGKVWYESFAAPDYIWQSSAATNDFEPKMSLTPLVFGTLKAAFYAMLMAMPIAICGAIYTAYFMAPSLRRMVKPTVEIMEALPTVILGFLAGLWLAPAIERNLPGVFGCLLILPLGVLAFAYGWQFVPERLRARVPEGWQPLLLMPVLAVLVLGSLALSPALEQLLFDGDMRGWLTNDLGIGFDQRNALVVGFAMGFAVIPPIFSIAEDAVFGVPNHLTQGSLALGATPWQTLSRVVLLTASPGIFSGIMIGFGRAVGETMIVLMATGNTPLIEMNLFQGMRTLSANIAVEMSESEVGSTHFRVLFLAALVLFILTFLVNSVAEQVRHRLRKKYGSL